MQTAVCRAWERQDSLRDPSAPAHLVLPHPGQTHAQICSASAGRVTYVPLENLEEGGYEDPPPRRRQSWPPRVDALPPEVSHRHPPCAFTRSSP